MSPFSSISSLKSPNSLHHPIFSLKPFASFKLRALIFPHFHRIARPAKTLILKLLNNTTKFSPLKKIKKRAAKKVIFGSFRLHYNWCSSHVVMPLGQENYSNHSNPNNNHASWDSHDRGRQDHADDHELSMYLEWLEEKARNNISQDNQFNEIDKLADLFIANCHEKFRLEKQESYRRFQEMMARSV